MSENRQRQFKNSGKGTEEGRRKRADASVELRKAKKEDQLMKRRNVSELATDEPISPLQERSPNAKIIPLLHVAEIKAGIMSNNESRQLEAVQSARRILSKERSPPIDEFIDAGVVPYLVEFLDHADRPNLQCESAWALTNIASGTTEQTIVVVKANAVPRFVKLLSSPEETVCEQAIWALGNIAGDGSAMRDVVINAGAVEPLLALVKPDAKLTFIRNLTWTLSNICRNKNPPPSFEATCKCLSSLSVLLHSPDREVLSDTCWALSYLTDGTNEKIQAVVDAGVLPRLVELLYHSESSVVTPALRCVGNIVTGNDEQTQAVVDTPGLLKAFPSLLKHSKCGIQKEAAWAISNITAGNQSQIQTVIDANIMPNVIRLMEKGDFKSQKEAVWVITNLTSGGTLNQISSIVEAGCLPPLIKLLEAKEAKTTLVVLDSINNIMLAAEKCGAKDAVAMKMEEYGALEGLELLQGHENNEIYQYAYRLIDTFFSDEADDVEGVVPEQTDNQYQFNGDSSQIPGNGYSF